MAHDAAMEKDLREALEQFKKTSGSNHQQLQLFQNASFESIQGAMAAIQQRQAQTKRLMYMKRLEPFLATMMEYGKVIEVFVNASEMLAFIWGPMKFILQAFISLLETYEYIGDQLPLLSHYQELFSSQKHMRDMLVLIFKDILAFHAEAVKYFTQKVWKQLFQATWKGFNLKIKGLKENFKRHRQLLEQQATLVEFEQIMYLRRHAEAEFQERQRQSCSNRRESVLRWLAAANCEAIHESLSAARSSTPEAGDWLMKDHRFQRWFDPLYCSTPLLWLNGIPGAGKSVLASVVTERARKIPNVSTIFFHCAENDPARNSFVSVARGLLTQLVAQDDALLTLVDEERSTRSGDVTLSSAVAAKRLLQVALKVRKTYIILDGIDECAREERKEICTWFSGLVDSLPKTGMDEIRCLFVSQDDGLARKDLGNLPTIRITSEDNNPDILAFAETCQVEIEDIFGKFNPAEFDIAKLVTKRSQGMFIFAKCALKEMSLQPSRSALLQDWKMEKFPAELDEVYDRIVTRILSTGSESRRKVVKKLLAWISCAKRPLFWYEIQGMISLDLGNECLFQESKRIAGDIKDFCASLVEIDHAYMLSLIHSTLEKYLFGKAIITPSEVDRELAHISISYLCFPQMSQHYPEAKLDSEVMAGTYAFYEYAVLHWATHLLAWLPHSTQRDIQEANEDLENFLDLHYIESAQVQALSKTMEDVLKPLESLECYPSFAQVIVWNRKLQLGQNSKKAEALLDFPKITAMIRSSVEHLFESNNAPGCRETIQNYYGQNIFKCPRTHCHYFTKGFNNSAERKEHIERHDRAYICSFDGCPMATIGCTSQKDLDKHLRSSHNIDNDANAFPDFPERAKTLFQCTLCPRKFTRAYTLRSHLRTHTDERPFVCTVCGRSFARQQDRKRHEALHSGEKKFICRGDLKTGGQWGCGRRFARAEALARHFRSEAGRMCMKPLSNEESIERQRLGNESFSDLSGDQALRPPNELSQDLMATLSGSAEYAGDIPEAILWQYPELMQPIQNNY